MSPGAITAVDSDGSKSPSIGTLTTVVIPKPEKTDGAFTSSHDVSRGPVELSTASRV